MSFYKGKSSLSKLLICPFSILLLYSFLIPTFAADSSKKSSSPSEVEARWNAMADYLISYLNLPAKEQKLFRRKVWINKGRIRDEDLKKVIPFLESRIGKEATQKKIIENTSVVLSLRYGRLKTLVEFYDEQIGIETVNTKMKKSLNGLQQGDINKIRKGVFFLQGYIGPDAVKERMKTDFESFGLIDVDSIRMTMEILIEYAGLEIARERMGKELSSFVRANPGELKRVFNFLTNRIGIKFLRDNIQSSLLPYSLITLAELLEYEKQLQQDLSPMPPIRIAQQTKYNLSSQNLAEKIKAYLKANKECGTSAPKIQKGFEPPPSQKR